jgi:hypothetical protein
MDSPALYLPLLLLTSLLTLCKDPALYFLSSDRLPLVHMCLSLTSLAFYSYSSSSVSLHLSPLTGQGAGAQSCKYEIQLLSVFDATLINAP